MLRDEASLKIKSGKGGDGAVKFMGTRKYPTGGNGGKGGDVYLEGTLDYYDLNKYSQEKILAAEDGEQGGENQKRGKTGNDLIIKVPLVTEVYSADSCNLILTVDKPGEKYLLLKGGEGGIGNYAFRAEGAEGSRKYTSGKSSKDLSAKLVLKLKSDIIFIGFPNAGKSSMLNALTNANVKVADYAFTTLSPHLGRVHGMTLMDLPGLIVGTHEERGLGTSFVKHTEYAKVVVHFISMENEDVLKAYRDMREEVESISPELALKPEIIVLTKSDEFSEEEIKHKLNEISSVHGETYVCSIIDDKALETLKDAMKKKLTTID